MRRPVLTLLTLLFALPLWGAERDSANHTFIHLRSGVGYGLYRDLGTSPITYRGLQLHPGISLEIQQLLWRYEGALLVDGGVYGIKPSINYIQAYGGHPLLGFRVWRKMAHHNHLHLWAGGSADNLFDIRYQSSLGNACAGFGNYARLNLEGCLEYTIGSWLFHAQLQLGALSLTTRPGFAYMDNFDQDISSPTANTFDQYHTYLALAAGAATDVGASLLLATGNRIGLSYHWSYLSSQSADASPHLFQYAHHALLFHLAFKIK